MKALATLIKLLGPKGLERVAKALGYQHVVRVETVRLESGPDGKCYVNNFPVLVFTKDPWSGFSSLVLERKLKDFWPNLGRTLNEVNKFATAHPDKATQINMDQWPEVGSVFVDWREL